MSKRELLLKRIAAIDFAIVELNLYMDTHPDDDEINEKLNMYREKSSNLRREYESLYGPLTLDNQEKNQWGWISDPWPWNNCEGDEN